LDFWYSPVKVARHGWQTKVWLAVVDVDDVGDDSENEEFDDMEKLSEAWDWEKVVGVSEVNVEVEESVGVLILVVFREVGKAYCALLGAKGAEAGR